MAAGQTCALPGCSKPPYPSPGRAAPHLTCGNLHHQLLMAGRFHPFLPHPHQDILDHNKAGLCALPSCCNPPHPGHSWCSKRHYLDWLSDFTSHLHPDQICRLPGCTRHVFVEENSSPTQFCGWRHCQKHVMLSALQGRHQQLPQQESLPSPPSSVERKCGHVPSVESLVRTLRDSPKSSEVYEDFFNKHPWNVCTEGHTCLLIVRCKFTSKGKRVMLTKDGYHWKQQGPPVSKNRSDYTYTLKYFTYKKRKGKQNDHHNGCTYVMEEYTIKGVEDLALVNLRKSGKQPATGGIRSVTEVKNACSQNISLPNSDEMDVFSNLDSLYNLDELFYSSTED